MRTPQEDYRTCAAVVAKGAERFAAAEAARRKARAEFRALLRAGKVREIVPPPYREPHPVTAEVQARFFTLRRAGKSLRQIAAETGFACTTIVKYTKGWKDAA